MTAYEMCISNIARAIFQIPKTIITDDNGNHCNAFDYSTGIAVGFCKDVEEVVLDITNAVAYLQRLSDSQQ